MTAPVPGPVRVDATLDPALSRWMWLVKWLLAIPHYVVLVFLYVGFLVVTVIAFFAILFTGRYPRALHAYSVGVLRWHWRVAYYALGVAGTDRYPPFTLADVPDYPARFGVEYPERMSRGLVLVKWWLLALPHYLVIGALGGAVVYAADRSREGNPQQMGPGLLGLLVLFAVVALLFTGRYPRGLFDLLVGLHRWILRVVAYAALLTDRYPPFRLDQGGRDPGGEPGPPPLTPTGASAAPAPVTS